MEMLDGFALPVACLATAGLTWLVARWTYGRRLAAAALRADKLDRARQHAHEQGLQARGQIGQLQSELERLRVRVRAYEAARQTAAATGGRPAAAAPSPRLAPAPASPARLPDFMDTLPMA